MLIMPVPLYQSQYPEMLGIQPFPDLPSNRYFVIPMISSCPIRVVSDLSFDCVSGFSFLSILLWPGTHDIVTWFFSVSVSRFGDSPKQVLNLRLFWLGRLRLLDCRKICGYVRIDASSYVIMAEWCGLHLWMELHIAIIRSWVPF